MKSRSIRVTNPVARNLLSSQASCRPSVVRSKRAYSRKGVKPSAEGY